MGVVNVQQGWPNSAGQVKADQQGNQSWGFTTFYTVLLEANTANPEQEALFASDIPAIGDYYGTSDAQCVGKSAKAIGPLLYEVTCEYAGQDNPLYAYYEKSWSFAKSTEPIDRDAAGNAILNPNGERITGVVKEISDLVYCVSRNVTQDQFDAHRAYMDAVNSVTFMGYAAKKARVVEISATRQISGAGRDWYWRETIRIQFRPRDDWRQRVLVEGHQYWTGRMLSTGRRELLPFRLGGGLEIDPKPHPLAADGRRLVDEADVATHVWQYKDIYPAMNLNQLGIS